MASETSKQRPIAVDLFAGAGGMTFGFEQAGFDVLLSVEVDPIHCAIHEYNFPFWSVLCKSVIDTTAAEIRNYSGIGDREIDVVFAGSPCQGFSLIGKRVVNDPRNSLLFQFKRLVLELEPKYFVLENVRGLTVGKHKQFLKTLIDEFQTGGYRVEENYQILNAANYGVPQTRERLFLIGCRQDRQLPNYPQPIAKPAKPNRQKHDLSDDIAVGPTVWEALKDLPEAKNYPELFERDWVLAEYGKPSKYAKLMRDSHSLEDDYSYERDYNRQLLTSSMLTKHSLLSMKRFENTQPGHREPVSRFHKLHPDGVSNTLRAGTDRNKGSFTAPRPIHPYTPRCVTVREAARLHSFPDWFRFHVTKWHGFRQVGNSVPPLLAKAVAAEMIRALGIVPFQPTVLRQLGDRQLLELTNSQAARRYQN